MDKIILTIERFYFNRKPPLDIDQWALQDKVSVLRSIWSNLIKIICADDDFNSLCFESCICHE